MGERVLHMKTIRKPFKMLKAMLVKNCTVCLTVLSASESVGKSICIWETWRVKSEPASVAVFFIMQTTSAPFTSETCTNIQKKNKNSVEVSIAHVKSN